MKEGGCYDNERGSVIKVIGILLIYASDLTVSFKLFSEIVFEILNELFMNLKWIVNGAQARRRARLSRMLAPALKTSAEYPAINC
jgi:hypothetical protein